MSTLKVRGVPDDVSRALKTRAAAEGQSLSEFVLRIIEREASKPTRAEILTRLASRRPVELDEDPAVTIRRMRES